MLNNKPEITPYHGRYRQQVLSAWEASVLSTHDFLAPDDFQEIKEAVQAIDFTAFPVYCLIENEKLLGFIGVADQKIEMLFLHPAYLGKGLGKRLVEFVIRESGADKVDVNEQNAGAVQFYERMGFETYERTEKDDQGRNYPLLRMKLKKK